MMMSGIRLVSIYQESLLQVLYLFLEIFCNNDKPNRIKNLQGIRYRYMRISNESTDTLKQVKQFIITSDHNYYRLHPTNGNHGDMELTKKVGVN